MHRIQSAIIALFLFLTFMTLDPGKAQAQSYVFGTASFAAPVVNSSSPPAGSPPIIAVDFNGDGIADFAILGSVSGTPGVSILMGRPDGTFAPMVNYPVQASGIAVGDFNGDGKQDIITVSDVDFPIATILLGNGDGTFQSASPINLGISNATYASVSAADVNGDGKMDLVLLTRQYGGTATMAVLMGHGDEIFDAPVTYTVPVAPYLSFADLNGDGKPDIVITGPSTMIAVLINNGNGTFQTPAQYSVTGVIACLAVADLNGDGKLDLVVSTGGQSAGIDVLLGMGDGTFANPVAYPSNLLNIYGSSLAVADFNGDGKLDVAATSNTGYGVVILVGKGDGSFQASPQIYSAGKGGVLLALDANGDGKPDLAMWGGGYQDFSSLAVIINQGNGTFPTASTYPVLKYPWLAVQGDFDGDGKLDIAVATDTVDTNGQYTGGIVSVLRGNGDGTFKPRQDTPSSTFPTVMARGDFNGDGKLDLVAVEETTSYTESLDTLIGNGDGTFQHIVGQSIPNTTSLAVGDFNHDGKLDVAATSGSAEAFYVFLGQGDGTFAAPVIYSTGSQVSGALGNITTADFNGDGILDLAISTSDGVSIVLGKGDGTFGAFMVVFPGAALRLVGDFNGDGKPDLVIQKSAGLYGAIGNGDGTFQQALSPLFASPYAPYGVPNVVGDFDGDGNLDIAFNDLNDGGISIVFGNGDGTFTRHVEYATEQIGALVPGDFNGDGALDLAITDIVDNTVEVWINSPVVVFYPNPLIFSTQLVGAPSADKTVTLRNSSPVPILFSDVGTVGDFSATNTCGSKLIPRESCQATVVFTPSADGNRLGSLIFTDSVPDSPQVISLIGKGTGPAAGFNPTALAFGNQGIGTSSAAKSVVLTNEGNAALTIGSIAASGDFAQTNTCGTSLIAGANCSINVVFHPTQVGSRTGTITVTDNAGDSPQTVALTGTGLGPVASVSPTSLTFTGQLIDSTSAAKPLMLSNTGGAVLTIGSIAASGDFAQTDTCGTSLAVNASCSINVTFTPTAGGGRSGAITLTDNAAASPQTVALTGTGEDFTLTVPSGSSSTASVSAGQTATYSLSFGGLGGMNQAINFTCTGAPSGATCTVTPPSVTPSGSGAIAVSVSVTTTAASVVAPKPRHTPPLGPGMPQLNIRLMMALLLGLLALQWFAFGRKGSSLPSRKFRWGRAIATNVALVLAITACGGGGGGGGGPVPNAGTPAGTYTLTVTGTASGSSPLKHSTTLTLKVS